MSADESGDVKWGLVGTCTTNLIAAVYVAYRARRAASALGSSSIKNNAVWLRGERRDLVYDDVAHH